MATFCAEPGCGALVQYGRCPAHRAPPRDVAPSLADVIVHKWYGSKRWQDLRASIIREQPFCRSCHAEGRRILTVDVDHVRKHRGNPYLFWNRENLQGLCKACHTRKTVRGE
jgi:5-methylcytosine-specific restriction protein A